jgi:hypothetical protein
MVHVNATFRTGITFVSPGQSQSPAGIFARISTVPYMKVNALTVLRRADLSGLRMLVGLPERSHPKNDGLVHLE